MHTTNNNTTQTQHSSSAPIPLPLADATSNLLRVLIEQADTREKKTIVDKATIEYLHDAVDHLPGFLRQVIILHYYKKLSVYSIAALLQLPHQMVTTRLAHSIYWLKIFVVKRKPPE